MLAVLLGIDGEEKSLAWKSSLIVCKYHEWRVSKVKNPSLQGRYSNSESQSVL